MMHATALEVLERLLADGFDNSAILGDDPSAEDYDEDETVAPRCSQCEALCINGVACHERGCPNVTTQKDDNYDGEDFFDAENLWEEYDEDEEDDE